MGHFQDHPVEELEPSLPRNGDTLPLLGPVLDAIESDDGMALGMTSQWPLVMSHVSPAGCSRTWEWCGDGKARPGPGSGSPAQSRRGSGHSSCARSACACHPSPEIWDKDSFNFSLVLLVRLVVNWDIFYLTLRAGLWTRACDLWIVVHKQPTAVSLWWWCETFQTLLTHYS